MGKIHGVLQSAHAHHVASLLVIGIDIEEIVGDVFHYDLDLLAGEVVYRRGGVGNRGLVHEMFHQDRISRQQTRPPAEAGREGDVGALNREQRFHDQLIERTVEISPAVKQSVSHCQFLAEFIAKWRARLFNVGGHFRVRWKKVGEYRQHFEAEVGDLAVFDFQVEYREKLAVGSRVDHERLAGFVRNHGGRGHGIVGVAAEDGVDARDTRGHLQVHVHAVVRQHDDHLRALAARLVDHFLHVFVVDAECPVRNHVSRVGDRSVWERLADYGDGNLVDFADDVRLEDQIAPGVVVDVLRQEFDVTFQVVVDNFLDALRAVGELPVAGHHIDAEQFLRVHHVLPFGPQRSGRSLPRVAAVEQQRAIRAAGAQFLDKGGDMRESADLAVTARGIREVEIGKGVRLDGIRCDVEMLEQGLAHQMRRFAPGRSDPDVDVRLPVIGWNQLRVTVGYVKQTDIAKRNRIVKVVRFFVGGQSATGVAVFEDKTGGGADRQHLQEFASGETHIFSVGFREMLNEGNPHDQFALK